MESFFSTLERDLVHRSYWRPGRNLERIVFDYIEVFYKRQRRYSALNYQTPSEFKEQRRTT